VLRAAFSGTVSECLSTCRKPHVAASPVDGAGRAAVSHVPGRGARRGAMF
jgi:hypothetical protein